LTRSQKIFQDLPNNITVGIFWVVQGTFADTLKHSFLLTSYQIFSHEQILCFQRGWTGSKNPAGTKTSQLTLNSVSKRPKKKPHFAKKRRYT